MGGRSSVTRYSHYPWSSIVLFERKTGKKKKLLHLIISLDFFWFLRSSHIAKIKWIHNGRHREVILRLYIHEIDPLSNNRIMPSTNWSQTRLFSTSGFLYLGIKENFNRKSRGDQRNRQWEEGKWSLIKINSQWSTSNRRGILTLQ